ncbi:MAG: S-layer homology domain-containing protein, partial [Clostridia bacterium]|nr:S-layer homology domain-containing protein [Clostridia bacterium]
DNGYMKGVGGDLFDPEGSLTRAMVATVLWRREGEPKPTAPSGFSDVPANEWYTDAVAWAKETGVVKGITATTFEPDGKITREQLATMLFRFSSSAPVSVPERADLTPFSDDEKVSEWANEPLEWAVEAGLIKGTDGNRLAPEGDATREQFAAIIERYDGSFKLAYNAPVLFSHYTEPEYPLVADADVYVAPDGDDGAAGDFDHPIATFARAVEMARELKGTVTDRSVVVAFRAGEYPSESVLMTSADSGSDEYPVVYCAYGDGEAIITGGAFITEERFSELDDADKALFDPAAAVKIKKADVSDVLPDYTTKDVIFSEDGALTVARYPNKYQDGTDQLFAQASYPVSDTAIRIDNVILQRRVAKYRTLDGLQLYGYLTTGWFKDTLDTDGYTVDGESGGFDFKIPDPTQARMGWLRFGEFPAQYYGNTAFQNMSEDLDAPGEYWVDPASHTLYVYDPHGTYSVPIRDRGLIMDGCRSVTFRGLSFKAYKETILTASRVYGITFDLCRFSVCSSTLAMSVSSAADADFNTTFTRCDFSVFAGRALAVGGASGWDTMFSRRDNFLFDNNRVSNTNLTVEWNAAVTAGGNGTVVSHNLFENCSYMALTYTGCNARIEYNVFKNVCYNSQDCGAVYTGTGPAQWDNVIRYNVFYPISEKAYGIYLDDNAPGAEIYGNLLIENTIVVHDGRSNSVHDNAMIGSNVGLSCGGLNEELEFYKNGGVGEKDRNFYPLWVQFMEHLDADPDLKKEYFDRYPELSLLTVDLDRVNDPNFVLCPRNYIKDNLFVTTHPDDVNDERDYGVVEGNVGVTYGENPIFVNPTRGDYRIREGADFPDIQFEKIGRY